MSPPETASGDHNPSEVRLSPALSSPVLARAVGSQRSRVTGEPGSAAWMPGWLRGSAGFLVRECTLLLLQDASRRQSDGMPARTGRALLWPDASVGGAGRPLSNRIERVSSSARMPPASAQWPHCTGAEQPLRGHTSTPSVLSTSRISLFRRLVEAALGSVFCQLPARPPSRTGSAPPVETAAGRWCVPWLATQGWALLGTRVSRFVMKCVRHLCQLAPANTVAMASLSPRCASEITVHTAQSPRGQRT